MIVLYLLYLCCSSLGYYWSKTRGKTLFKSWKMRENQIRAKAAVSFALSLCLSLSLTLSTSHKKRKCNMIHI